MKNLTGPLKRPMASKFRKIRAALGLTQKQLAAKIGNRVETIADIEIEKRLPTIPVLISLYKELNLSFDWLLLGEGDMFRKDKKPVLSRLELFKKVFPDVPAEPDVIRLIESMAIPVLKNSVILKSIELKDFYKSHIEEYEKEKAQALSSKKMEE